MNQLEAKEKIQELVEEFDFEDYQKLNGYKTIVPQYIRDSAYHLTNL